MARLMASVSTVTPSPLAPKRVTSKMRPSPDRPSDSSSAGAAAAGPAPTSGSAAPAAPAAPQVTTRRRLNELPTGSPPPDPPLAPRALGRASTADRGFPGYAPGES